MSGCSVNGPPCSTCGGEIWDDERAAGSHVCNVASLSVKTRPRVYRYDFDGFAVVRIASDGRTRLLAVFAENPAAESYVNVLRRLAVDGETVEIKHGRTVVAFND